MKMIENILDFYDFNKKPLNEISEYLVNFDLNIKFIILFRRIFHAIKVKIYDPSKEGIIDVTVPYLPFHLNPLLFLSIILNKEKYLPEIQKLIENKIQNSVNVEFLNDYIEIIYLLKGESDLQTLSGTIIIPISLITFRYKELDTAIRYTVSRNVLNPTESIISDVKFIRSCFETGLKKIIQESWSSEDFTELQKVYETIGSVESDYEVIEKIARKTKKSLEDSLGISIGRNLILSLSNVLEEIYKHPLLGRKYKNIIICFDELVLWWHGSNDELLHIFRVFIEKVLLSHELLDSNGKSIEKNNVFTIFKHQKNIFIGNQGQTLRNKLKNVFTY